MKLDAALLLENPLVDLQLLGNQDSPQSQTARDMKLLQNPKYLRKVYERWKGVNWNVAIYVLNIDALWPKISLKQNPAHYLEQSSGASVSPDFLRKEFGDAIADYVEAGQKDSQISIIFTNNDGANTIPFTPWILAHRMGHIIAVNPEHWRDLVKNVSTILWLYMHHYYISKDMSFPDSVSQQTGNNSALNNALVVFKQLFTYKSVQGTNKLNANSEIVVEMFADWLLNGHIRYNPFPPEFEVEGTTLYCDDVDSVNRQLDAVISDYQLKFTDIMNSMRGEIFIL